MTAPRHLRFLLLSAGIAHASGCALGPKSLDHSRMKYNEVIQRTAKEEMLKNLVRLKYREPPEFVAVPNITQQYNFAGEGAVSVHPMLPRELFASLGAAASNTPTLIFTPLQDQEFNTRLLSPISLETLDLLTRGGWAMDRVTRLTIQTINDVDNATSAGGPTPDLKPDFERFTYATNLLRKLQQARQVEIVIVTVDEPAEQRSGAIEAARVSPQDLVNAARHDLEFRISKDGRFSTLWTRPRERQVMTLEFAPEVIGSPIHREIVELLNLENVQASYELEAEAEGHLKERFQRKRKLTVSTRSVFEAMYYLSHAIDVPPQHVEQGLVTATFDAEDQYFDWIKMTGDLLRVHVDKHRPKDAAVAVHHLDHWYYIDDRDLQSKSTFKLLLELYNLEIRGGGGRQIPVVTIGAGGRR